MSMIHHMSTLKTSKWHEIKNKLKYQYDHLTKNDFEYIVEEKPHIVGELQSRCGYSRQIAEKAVNNFFVLPYQLSN
jgi:hypothetical protein